VQGGLAGRVFPGVVLKGRLRRAGGQGVGAGRAGGGDEPGELQAVGDLAVQAGAEAAYLAELVLLVQGGDVAGGGGRAERRA